MSAPDVAAAAEYRAVSAVFDSWVQQLLVALGAKEGYFPCKSELKSSHDDISDDRWLQILSALAWSSTAVHNAR